MSKSQDILNAISGFEKSRIILTACELDLFTQIHQDPTTASKLAESNDLNFAATKRLLDCLVSFKLLSQKKGQYEVTSEGTLFSAYSAENILPIVKVYNKSWNKWHNLTEVIKNGQKSQLENKHKGKEDVDKNFIELMHMLGRELSSEIADIYNLSPFRKMLDIGGASGTYSISFLKKNSEMKATLFDVDSVLPLAENRLKSEGLLNRVELRGGDYNIDELPKGYDLVLVSDLIGQNSNEQNFTLFKKIHNSLTSNGVLLIRDFVMDETHTIPESGALFSMLMLVETHGVGVYSLREYQDVLQKAGFSEIKLVKKGKKKNSLIEARKST